MLRWSGKFGSRGGEEVHWGEDTESLGRMTCYAAAEDQHILGSAYWVWKQACGDPQNGILAIGNGLMVEDCATGIDITSRAAPLNSSAVSTRSMSLER